MRKYDSRKIAQWEKKMIRLFGIFLIIIGATVLHGVVAVIVVIGGIVLLIRG